MNISIVGTGYVGLVTGISLATLGHKVICVDNDAKKVIQINKGEPPFFEPGVNELLKKELSNETFRATEDLEKAVLESEVTIIAVGTPTLDDKIDLSYIKKATAQVGLTLGKSGKYHVVAIKSTVLPGVTEEVVKPILEKYSSKKVGSFGLCMNPEFLREGSALKDALNPDRIVIGQFDEKSGKEFSKIYAKFSCPKIFTNLWTAEMTKYTANSLLATLVSFSNEMARIAEGTGKIDIVDVWEGVHLDKRLSPIIGKQRVKPGILSYLFSGCGFGGSCFPKDIQALASFAADKKIGAKILRGVIDINKTQPHRMILHLKKALGENLKGKKVVILGLAFKANTNDIRESAAFPIIEELISEGAKVTCHDPFAYKESVPEKLKELSIDLAASVKKAIEKADAVLIVTAWEEYTKLSPVFFKRNMNKPIVIDGRRIYDKNAFTQAGITYRGIGL